MKININNERFNDDSFVLDKERQVEGTLASLVKPWLKYYDTDVKNYSDEKKAGYQQALDYYLSQTDKYRDNLKLLEAEIKNDLNTYKSKVRSSNVDNFLLGYYDGLQMIKKVINNSKNDRFAELNNKIGK